jgi:hypothetical protein
MIFSAKRGVKIDSKYAVISSLYKEKSFIPFKPLRAMQAELEPDQISSITSLNPDTVLESTMTIHVSDGDTLRCDYSDKEVNFKSDDFGMSFKMPFTTIKKYINEGGNKYIITVNNLDSEAEILNGEIIDDYLGIELDGFENQIKIGRIESIDFDVNRMKDVGELHDAKIYLKNGSVIYADVLFDSFTIRRDGIDDEAYYIKTHGIKKVEFPNSNNKDAKIIFKENDNLPPFVTGTIKEKFFSVKPIGYAVEGISIDAEKIIAMEFPD